MNNSGDQIVLREVRKSGPFSNLIFSNGFEVRASSGTMKKLGLKEGNRYNPESFEAIRQILEKDYAYFVAEMILARQGYSIGEFRQRLRKKGIEEKLCAGIVNDFRSLGLLDDSRYAEARIRSLLQRKPAGRGFLIADLQKHLVRRAIAEHVVAAALEDTDEVSLAIQILQKRRISLQKFDIETARRKAYTYLSRRAISYRAAKEAFEKVFASD
jgi:SOS response regulatory protein OraA/RecX